mmetsp:Transcript_30216/g.88113  ORF Transcript_30216/g.88113 Transcript_30216/m.88113 type:complete len:328 (+) Transcript_30216:174-1157(+)
MVCHIGRRGGGGGFRGSSVRRASVGSGESSRLCLCRRVGRRLRRALCRLLLLHGGVKLAGERARRAHPGEDDAAEDDGEVGRRRGERAEAKDEQLLHEAPARLAERPADDVDGGLALGLLLGVEGDVGHLLARVEEGVLCRLGHDVLRRADKDGEHERREADRREERREGVACEAESEEGDAGAEQHRGRDHRCGAPAPLAEDEPPKEHHGKRGDAGGGRERSHEGRVGAWVGEGLLELALPCHLDEVDCHPVADDQSREGANVRRGGEVARRLSNRHARLLLLLWRELARRRGGAVRTVRLLQDGHVEVAKGGHDDTARRDNSRHE